PASDYTYEVVLVNERTRKRMLGEDPGPPPTEGWMTCPEEMLDREKLAKALVDGAEQILSDYDALGEDKALMPLQTPYGERTPADLLTFMAIHTMYHDGQLNLLQSLYGDDKMNWPD
ncbi:MAG: DinB family protein, partial [Armatimonadota bacterium]